MKTLGHVSAFVSLAFVSSVAHSALIQSLECDYKNACLDSWIAFEEQSGWTKALGYQVSEGQPGNWAAAIVGDDNSSTLNQADIDWGTDLSEHDFEFKYLSTPDSYEQTVHLTAAETGISIGDFRLDNANALAIRAVERNKGNETDARADLTELNLTLGENTTTNILSDHSSLDGDSNGQWLLITGVDLTQGFTLQGKAAFDIGDTSDGFRTAYEVKVGHVASVPLPGSLLLLGSGLLGFIGFRWLTSVGGRT